MFRFFEDYPPSEALICVMFALVAFTEGLRCGVVLLLGIGVATAGVWLDNHGTSKE